MLGVLKGVQRLIVAKGSKVTAFDLKKARPDDDELIAAMTGPTGNLRAPTLRSGKTLIVGFHADSYDEAL